MSVDDDLRRPAVGEPRSEPVACSHLGDEAVQGGLDVAVARDSPHVVSWYSVNVDSATEA